MPGRAIILAAIIALAGVVAAPHLAEAQASRTFVAGTGVDSGTCAVTAPCRSFAYAMTQTAVSGEIIVLSSAGYGCGLSIAQSISIIAPPGISGRMSCSGGTAITVNGSGIDVALEGLGIDGASTGILFQSGQLLSLVNIEINGGNNGVQHNAPGGFLSISGALLRNGSNCFIAQVEGRSGTAYATIVNSRAENCEFGFLAHANSFVAVSNSVATGTDVTNSDCYADFIALGDPTGIGTLALDNIVATSCYYGVAAAPLATGGTGQITFANSLVTNNNTGTAAFGKIYTFGNNRVYGNFNEQNNSSLTPISAE